MEHVTLKARLALSLLTTEANGVVRPIHTKAMSVLLTTPEE
jgi:putative SOS response-associated peptidase YedK